MKYLIALLFFLLTGVAFFSCKKPAPPVPGPPIINYLDFNVISLTPQPPKPEAIIHFGFTDPDGDIGLTDGDTTGAFAFGSPYHNDFHMIILSIDSNGLFVPDTGTYQGAPYGVWTYRTPYVPNITRDKALSGEVFVNLTGFRPFNTVKRFKYQFYMYDRAHNKSNVVTTPEFNYP